MKFTLFVVAITFISLTSLFGQDSLRIDQSDNTNNSITETEYYQSLLNQSEQHKTELLQTLYYSLQTSFAILVILIGSSIYYNYRIGKKEVDNIFKEVNERVNATKSEILSSLEDDFETLKKSVEKNIESSLNSFQKEIDVYGKSQDERFDSLNSSISNVKESNQLKIDQINNIIDFRLKLIEQKLEKNSGRIWNLEGVKNNALSSFIRVANKNLDTSFDPQFILDDIIKTLSEMVSITEDNYESLNKLLERLGDDMESRKNIIRTTIEDLPKIDLADLHSFKISNIQSILEKLINDEE